MEYKKKILFVMPTIACGGAEKALIELLKSLDKNCYDIDLLLFRKDDMFYLNEIPSYISILDNTEDMKQCFDHVKHLFHKRNLFKNFKLIFTRLYLTSIMKLRKIFKIKKAFYQWDTLKKYVPTLKNKYDVAIGYLEGDATFFVIDKVNSSKKIGWMHTDYIMGGFSKNHDYNYFQQLDKIFCVSELNAKNLSKVFIDFEDKIDVMYNIINKDEFFSKSNMCMPWDDEYSGIRIISVGNLRFVKGYDLAIKACHKLIKDGHDVKWYVVGEGNERRVLEKLVHKYNLEDRFILMGLSNNPYFYIQKADIFVQCSRHEGFSTTVTEAKLFAKPIVVTDCPGMNDQINSNENGLVVQINEEDIYNGIKLLLNNPSLCNKFSIYLSSENIVASKNLQLEHFYESINS